ncbi:MAG: hypothetical protein AUI16_03565 [Alphaproteobacteria bacterium 13_2_20CM_2_64_7]|nr:MAG: hypothetical protein AUI16_03565 [Alphaproteobacteria bacterium 13_2_20CM_2_64_7]
MKALTDDMKARLTWWLVEQRRQGEACPTITTYTLDQVRALPAPSITERRDRILDYMAGSRTLVTRLQLSGQITPKLKQTRQKIEALTGSQNHLEVTELVRFAKEDGLLQGDDTVQLTFKGWKHVEERGHRIASIQAFVAMWFSTEMETAYEQGFAPAIRDSGYEPVRIDRKEHVNRIDDEMIAEIRRSRFLVADFTSEPERPRGGVYFEAGFAYGLNMPVIWACRKDLVEQLHFDIRQFNHIVWTEPENLYERLKNRIGAILGDGPRSKPK